MAGRRLYDATPTHRPAPEPLGTDLPGAGGGGGGGLHSRRLKGIIEYIYIYIYVKQLCSPFQA